MLSGALLAGNGVGAFLCIGMGAADGEDTAAEIFKHMERGEVIEIAKAMQTLGRVEKSMQDELVKEFLGAISTSGPKVSGGLDKKGKSRSRLDPCGYTVGVSYGELAQVEML